MCGLMGYCGRDAAGPRLIKGLKRLEYRGYDSAGIATLENYKIICEKDSGKVSDIEKRLRLSSLPGTTGIGHVRWATNGKVTRANAHPQTDCFNRVAVVHNGIIENWVELRERLGEHNAFASDTDSEIIPVLLADHIHSGSTFTEAVALTSAGLKGPYAYLAISAVHPDTLMATCSDMPLIIGCAPEGYYASSDLDSLPATCDSAAHLENGEIAVLTPDYIRFTDAGGHFVVKDFKDINREGADTAEEVFGYHMLKEIHEQPWAIRQAMLQNRETLDGCIRDIAAAKDVVFVACGSSRYAALLGRYLFSRIGKKFSEVVTASEYSYFSDSISENTLVIAISQSGETADVLDSVRAARKKGARILSIVNREESLLGRLSDHVLHIRCGPEIGVAATKSYTAQLVVLYLLAYGLGGKLDYALRELRASADMIADSMSSFDLDAQELVLHMKQHGCFVIARGSNLHVATEAALKIKEVAYMYTEAMSAGELKHGSLALIEEGTPVFVIAPDDYTFNDTLANAEEARSRGAYIIGISDRDSPVFNRRVNIPAVQQDFYPLVSIVPLQLMAYYLAVAQGFDPDRPRNLAKSVTVK